MRSPVGLPRASKPRTAKPVLFASLASLVLLLGLVSCGGGGGGGGHHFVGSLEVANDQFSADFIAQIDVDEIGGPDHFTFSVFVQPSESFFVDLFPATYDVTVYWGGGFIEGHTVDVFDGFTTVLPVSN
jgi:hypothetical protein